MKNTDLLIRFEKNGRVYLLDATREGYTHLTFDSLDEADKFAVRLLKAIGVAQTVVL